MLKPIQWSKVSSKHKTGKKVLIWSGKSDISGFPFIAQFTKRDLWKYWMRVGEAHDWDIDYAVEINKPSEDGPIPWQDIKHAPETQEDDPVLIWCAKNDGCPVVGHMNEREEWTSIGSFSVFPFEPSHWALIVCPGDLDAANKYFEERHRQQLMAIANS